MTLQEQIDQYLDYLENFAYIDAILTAIDLPTLFELIAEMLQAGDTQRRIMTCVFIRDVILLSHFASADQFRAGFYESPIVAALENNLSADVFMVRHNVVYTIGKVGLQA